MSAEMTLLGFARLLRSLLEGGYESVEGSISIVADRPDENAITINTYGRDGQRERVSVVIGQDKIDFARIDMMGRESDRLRDLLIVRMRRKT